MTSDRLITPISIVLVILLHYGLYILGHSYHKPSLEIGEWAMEVVDLGDLDLGQGQEIGIPDAEPKEEPHKPEPKPKPKPKPEPKPVKEKIIAKKTTEPADIVSKQEEEIKPVQDTSSASDDATDVADTDNMAGGPARGGDRKIAGGGRSGSGSGSTQATHMGGHLRNPKPPYPPMSLENGEEGTVGLTVVVEADGRPSDVQLAKSSGYRRLDNSALKTVKSKYRFTPATRGGFPIRATYTFNIVFKIE